jgi:epoxyqueuosine reductase QueG
MKCAAQSPVILESARKYVEAASIAIQLASWIRLQGFPARAHIDENYRVIAPLVARDAGLGEIGRMGILMTPNLGPRVRLGVVTTNMPLDPDPRNPDPSKLDFCSQCVKCAENCPSRAIPFEEADLYDGGKRWKLDEQKCFHYWNVIGTDCGICMAVCPYSHPDNWAHNMVRWSIRRSAFARRVAIYLDDLFYGHKPSKGTPPEWLTLDNNHSK